MDSKIYSQYVDILNEELMPAMGCTEPISVAYASAKAKQILGEEPLSASLYVSANIVKNVKSVTVPHTGGLIGLKAAVLVGLVSGNADLELQVLSQAKKEDEEVIQEKMETFPLEIDVPEDFHTFDIAVGLVGKEHTSYVRITDDHTFISLIERDGEVLFSKELTPMKRTDRSCLTIQGILEFADEVKIEDVEPVIRRQIEYNMAIAEEGMKNDYGANIGKLYYNSKYVSLQCKAKAFAAAGSDARMNGCELPVVINSGSGNQGLTTSVPVIVYARELAKSDEEMIRALVVANLVTIHLKSGIGALSAYCGVVSAGAGAAAGISYMNGKGYEEISHVIINTLAIDSGIICDGAKASCAAKIATAVETGFLGIRMQESSNDFYAGCGIVKQDVEKTIQSVNRLAKQGMSSTDKEIIRIMLEQ